MPGNEAHIVGKKPIPDGGYGWVVLVASFFINFMIDGLMYSFALMLDEIQLHFKATELEANLVVGLNQAFYFLSGPIVAGLVSSFGYRKVVIWSSLVTSSLYFFCVFSPSIVLIWIFYGVIGGISTGCIISPTQIITTEWFDKKLGLANGIMMAGTGVGSFFVPNSYFGMRYFIKNYDWKIAMSICATGILLCCGLGAFLKPLNPINKEEKKKIQTLMGSTISLESSDNKESFFKMMIHILKDMVNISLLGKNMGLLLITLSNLCLFTGYFLPYRYLPSIAEKKAGMSDPTILLSLIGGLNTSLRLLFGWIIDTKIITPINLNALCILISTIPFFLFQQYLQYEIWGQLLFAVTCAIGGAGLSSLTTAYLIDIAGVENFGKAIGIINLFRGFGCVGLIIAGEFLDRTGWEKAMAFYFTAICYLFGFIFATMCSLWCMARKPKDDVKNVSEIVDLLKSPESDVPRFVNA